MKSKPRTKSFVYIDLPRAGLGNKLTVWARGMVFAKINNLPVYCSKWWHFSVGPLLRGELRSRWYFGYFKHKYVWGWIKYNISKPFFDIVSEPPITINEQVKPTIYVFKNHIYEGVTNSDLYRDLKQHRDYLKSNLKGIFSQKIMDELKTIEPGTIGLHVRRGDFHNMSWGVTSDDYFKSVVNGLREISSKELTAKIYSDAHQEELEELLSLKDVQLSSGKSDIVDLIELSKSEVIVYSKGSSFSNWAGFLSEAHLIHPPREDKLIPCREIDKFEVSLSPNTDNWPADFVNEFN